MLRCDFASPAGNGTHALDCFGVGMKPNCGTSGTHGEVDQSNVCPLVMALGFMLHLAACRSCALTVVSPMGESREPSYRNRWIR